jgi:hypothetical protein
MIFRSPLGAAHRPDDPTEAARSSCALIGQTADRRDK